MRKLLLSISFISFCFINNYAAINYIQGEYVNSTTVRLWFNMDTNFGENGYAQCRYNSGSTFTGFIVGNFDNTTVGGANWKIEIDFGGLIPAVFDIEGAITERSEYTGFAWSESLSNLPVELSNFTATKETNAVTLNWTTLSEENNAGFDIEKSVNGKDFEVIGTVEGAGNSIDKIDYSFMDESPANGINYYRLKQTDFDGAFEYSEIVSVEMKANVQATIYPNPTADVLTIRGEIQAKVNIRVFNPFGELVYENIQSIDNQSNINLSHLPTGNYLLHIVSDKTKTVVFSNHFIKE